MDNKESLNVELTLRVVSLRFVGSVCEVECMASQLQETIVFRIPRNDDALERQLEFFVHNALTNKPKEG